MSNINELVIEAMSTFEKLRKNKVPLEDHERDLVIKRKAVWHNHPTDPNKPTPAVWKSVHPTTKKVTYGTHTHRLFQIAPTLKGAIYKYHHGVKQSA